MDAQYGVSCTNLNKRIIVDGHKRPDVVVYRKKFLWRMVSLGFLNSMNAPTDEARQALSSDLECPRQSILGCFFMTNQHFNATMINQPSAALKAPMLSSQNQNGLASWCQISLMKKTPNILH